MYKYILQEGGNINWMALLALTTFVAVFVIGGVLAFNSKKDALDRMSRLPLDEDIAEI